MEILNADHFDPYILLGIVNERLQLNCRNLQKLYDDTDISSQQLDRLMQQIHYHYQIENNQFIHD